MSDPKVGDVVVLNQQKLLDVFPNVSLCFINLNNYSNAFQKHDIIKECKFLVITEISHWDRTHYDLKDTERNIVYPKCPRDYFLTAEDMIASLSDFNKSDIGSDHGKEKA